MVGNAGTKHRSGRTCKHGHIVALATDLQPFRLVWGDLRNASYRYTRYGSDLEFAKSGFNGRCAPERFLFDPKASSAVLTYNVSSYIAQNNLYLSRPAVVSNMNLGLMAYNARDFGYGYLQIHTAKSSNIAKPASNPTAITQYFHCGGSCGMPGGCNNMSPKIPELEDIQITKLPARCAIKLWKQQPSSSTQAADFTFYIDFK